MKKNNLYSGKLVVTVTPKYFAGNTALRLRIKFPGKEIVDFENARAEQAIFLTKKFMMETNARSHLLQFLSEIPKHVPQTPNTALDCINQFIPFLRLRHSMSDSQLRLLYEVLTGSGVDQVDINGKVFPYVWNKEATILQHHFVFSRGSWDGTLEEKNFLDTGLVPQFRVFPLDRTHSWSLSLAYFGNFTVTCSDQSFCD